MILFKGWIQTHMDWLSMDVGSFYFFSYILILYSYSFVWVAWEFIFSKFSALVLYVEKLFFSRPHNDKFFCHASSFVN